MRTQRETDLEDEVKRLTERNKHLEERFGYLEGDWDRRNHIIARLQARVDELETRCNHEFPPMKFGGPPRQCLRCGETEGRAIKALEGEGK